MNKESILETIQSIKPEYSSLSLNDKIVGNLDHKNLLEIYLKVEEQYEVNIDDSALEVLDANMKIENFVDGLINKTY